MFGWGLDVWDSWSFFKLLDTDGGGSIELEALEVGLGRLGRFQRLIFMYSDWPFMWTGNMLVYWMQTHPWSLTKKNLKMSYPLNSKGDSELDETPCILKVPFVKLWGGLGIFMDAPFDLEEFFMGCLRLGGNARAMDLCKVLQETPGRRCEAPIFEMFPGSPSV